MCRSATTDIHTGERAKTGCLGGRIMCLGVATDLHRGKSKYWLSRRQDSVPECSDRSKHRKKSID